MLKRLQGWSQEIVQQLAGWTEVILSESSAEVITEARGGRRGGGSHRGGGEAPRSRARLARRRVTFS